jgi:hypothetical protein
MQHTKRAPSYADPSTAAQLTVVLDENGFTHIGFHLRFGSEQIIYDPQGNYSGKLGGNDFIAGKDASLSRYVNDAYSKGANIRV